MADYEEVLNKVRKLSVLDQARLLEEVAKLVRAHIQAWPKHSVQELKGLGKELWRGIDVEKYIEEEHNSWGRE